MLLDEALKHIKDTQPPETVQSWIELLSGEFMGLICSQGQILTSFCLLIRSFILLTVCLQS